MGNMSVPEWLGTTSLARWIFTFDFEMSPFWFERSKIGDEVITAPQATWVDVVTKEHTWDGLSTHGLNPRIGLGHKVHHGTKMECVVF